MVMKQKQTLHFYVQNNFIGKKAKSVNRFQRCNLFALKFDYESETRVKQLIPVMEAVKETRNFSKCNSFITI